MTSTAAPRTPLPLRLAARLTERVKAAFASGEMLEQVTPVTAELLRYWFYEPFTTERNVNFHAGQRQGILNVIYLHEVMGVERVVETYEKVAPELLAEADLMELAQAKYRMPKYAVKMATGTGKTWVMHALMLWQLLNARHGGGQRFTQRFLVVAPGLVVYDRLLDAYKGRLRADGTGRDPMTNDLHANAELFIPPHYRDEVFGFVQNNTVSKEDGIGRKTTGEGLIALTNWHLFMDENEPEEADDAETPGAAGVVKDLLPVKPGTTAGHALDALDRRYLRGTEMGYLADLPDLMVINDEAHHLHEDDLEWQHGLNRIAEGKAPGRFIQLDFSATPYTTTGSGRSRQQHFFPHIVTDFDLTTAMRQGLVKTLLLSRRKELTDLELDFRAKRDGKKAIALSDGQRLMLRAGLTKLRELEKKFVNLREDKHPKMLVMCEDTTVTPLVERFLTAEEGLAAADVLRIDSSAKGEMKDAEWLRVKEQLFNVDRYAQPKVIVSVLMLREGFDVNNICVIVPLRSTESSILLEQTIGRGLRLMWRDPEFQDEKAENRERVLRRKEPPTSYIDMLTVVEHPAFLRFYQDLLAGGLAAEDDGTGAATKNATGDLINVGLKEGYERYDMTWPIVTRDAEEEITPTQIDVATLAPFTAYTLDVLREFLATPGETFTLQAVMTETQFGAYEVKADLFTAQSYNEYLQKLLRTVTQRQMRVTQRSYKSMPMLQVNEAEVVRLLDEYIRTRLFGGAFDPFEGNDWKILLARQGAVTQHIVREMSIAIHRMQEAVQTSEAVVEQVPFSSVATLTMRESCSLELQKTIYQRLGYPSHGGGLERDFAEFLDRDGEVERFVKISEARHTFAVIYYLRTDGLLASYHPDFIVQTATTCYLIETKGADRMDHGNVQQKKRATVEWCRKINGLAPEDRSRRTWEYVLLSDEAFYAQSANGATLADLCRLNRVSMQEATGELFGN